jgi:hypothetical protein
VKGSVGILIAGYEASASLTINTSSTVTDTNTESRTESKTETDTIPISVPPLSHVDASHTFILYQVPIPFSGTVVLDGPVARNLDGISVLSQILPNKSDRTFTFSGTITDSTLVKTATSFNQKKVDPASCKVIGNKFVVESEGER